MATNPMHQFNVYKIGPEIKINGIDLSFTNASLFMLISAISISIFLLLGTKDKTVNTDKKGIFLGNAFKLGTELVAAVIVGTIIGFILDNWFGTKPLLIILFFLFGSAAGIYNVIKTAKKMQENKE